MSVFQILKNNVLIIDGDKSYMDTVDNFLADAGAVSVPESVIYDDAQASTASVHLPCAVRLFFKRISDCINLLYSSSFR